MHLLTRVIVLGYVLDAFADPANLIFRLDCTDFYSVQQTPFRGELNSRKVPSLAGNMVAGSKIRGSGRVVGHPYLTGLWKGCPSLGHNRRASGMVTLDDWAFSEPHDALNLTTCRYRLRAIVADPGCPSRESGPNSNRA